MGSVKVYDRAGEFRIEIGGKFAGDAINEVASTWRNALLEGGPRRFTIDISRLSGYDAAGRDLLHQMYSHGTHISAGTPLSLVFLNEISTPLRRGPASLREVPKRAEESRLPAQLRARAAGQ